MVVKVVHVLFVFIHERRHVVELHLQVHHLKKIQTDVQLALSVRNLTDILIQRPVIDNSSSSGSPAGWGRSTRQWTWRFSGGQIWCCSGGSACFAWCCSCWTWWRSEPGCSSASRWSTSGGPESPRRLFSAGRLSTSCWAEDENTQLDIKHQLHSNYLAYSKTVCFICIFYFLNETVYIVPFHPKLQMWLYLQASRQNSCVQSPALHLFVHLSATVVLTCCAVALTLYWSSVRVFIFSSVSSITSFQPSTRSR